LFTRPLRERGSGRRLSRLPSRVIFNELPESFRKRTPGRARARARWWGREGGRQRGDSETRKEVGRAGEEEFVGQSREGEEELPAKNINNAF